jgi:hypothetical protein
MSRPAAGGPERTSYLKTTVPAGGLGLFALLATCLLVGRGPALVTAVVEGIGGAVAAAGLAVAVAGLVVMYRDARETAGQPDLFLAWNTSRSEEAIAGGRVDLGIRVRRAVRWLLGSRRLLVGDTVQVRPLAEITATLDPRGSLDGLPFMGEMAAFCGGQGRVFRCVDKVYDYAGTKTLRRISDVVLLAGLRCDGSAHGRCQASCYLLWKESWLRRRGEASAAPAAATAAPAVAGEPWRTVNPRPGGYTCQYTELAAASRPLRHWDVWQDVRPLLNGNVTLRAFSVAVLTRLFNAVQRVRGGVGYPAIGTLRPVPPNGAPRPVGEGDIVRVVRKEQIVGTLDDKGRHRGLWFDREMVKYCGQRHTVIKRIDRIIDGANGQMVQMKSPCLALAGADATGEFLRFCAQHEYPFWRDVWLLPEAADPSSRTGG